MVLSGTLHAISTQAGTPRCGPRDDREDACRASALREAASGLMTLEGTARSRHLDANSAGRTSTSNGSDEPSDRVLRSWCPAEAAGS